MDKLNNTHIHYDNDSHYQNQDLINLFFLDRSDWRHRSWNNLLHQS